ncbi:MAG: cobalamin-dependent protein [Spirochaetales bacterium]|nr:cobalamin-dependent protein [Spirochaetales bacterium]
MIANLEVLNHDYLESLLKGDRRKASEMIMRAVEEGINIKDIYLHIFQPSLYEIGRLWQNNKISVAVEHFCTASTQLIISQLYPYIFNNNKKGRRMIATCVGSELHEMGIRIVADFFEMDGWDTYYLGANSPTNSVIEAIESYQAQLIAISATMTFHIKALKDLVAAIRNSSAGKNLAVLVGGRPFNLSADLWQQVKADGFGKDAQDAIDQANKIVEGKYK